MKAGRAHSDELTEGGTYKLYEGIAKRLANSACVCTSCSYSVFHAQLQKKLTERSPPSHSFGT